jgi:GntR family transcriptional repressor for pyruvate dehydrogenase complex
MADLIGRRFKRVEVQLAYRTVAAAVGEQILDGRIKPGQRLPPEVELARQLGVNRSTVREGLRALEQEGLVRRADGRGLVASAPHQGELATRLSRAMVLHHVTFLELCETILALEPLAAELASQRIDERTLRALEENLARTRESLDNRQSLTELDVDFHLLLSRGAGNKALMLAREPLGLLFYPAFFQVMARLNSGERLLLAHESIVAAVRAHQPVEARQWMHRHIVDFKRGYELLSLDLSQPIAPGPGGKR